ncbi:MULTISPECIES: conserved phage C-terminal domain-containing protein [Cysteiniphilum]|uniref:Phage replisome organiser N-terminal domain-containing protein n=1 Tax=Cysteiniphilum litorale TaxID=2056700 RepID=A0A8J2Z7B3_9GAMM|nr:MULTISPECIES: conserved phage C-terminal domain-containing protein [Cysteiniphilum]GGG09117.1 hypothetical protein GCM10010995_28390 [Cysteiniphilum litorale]
MLNKRFYWLKLKEGFFSEPKIKKLRRIAGGDTYTVIFQKIMLLSIKNQGFIIFEGIEKTFANELALIMDEDEDNVEVTVEFMLRAGLLEEVEPSKFLVTSVLDLIGSESESAARVRKYRDHKKNEKNSKALQCNMEVTQQKRGSNKNVTTDIRDKKEDIDNIDTSNEVSLSGKPDDANQKSYPYAEIVNHLNQKTGSNYQSTCKKTRELIRARFADGHDVDAFKRAVDNQVALWWHDFKMRPYLRPETLFSPKMDGYANANVTPEQIAVAQGKVGEPIARGMEEGTFNIKAMF